MSDEGDYAHTPPTSKEAHPYGKAPDSLMGFRRNGPQTPYDQQKYKHDQKVRVSFEKTPHLPADSFEDRQKGLNRAHALERARRNWPGAKIEAID